LKNVKETSGFYERSSALWVRVFDLFNSFENRDHFENCGHIWEQVLWFLWELQAWILRITVITTMRKSCLLHQLWWFVFVSNTQPTMVYVPLMFLASFVQVCKQRLPTTHHTHWMKHPRDPGFFWACYEFQIFWTITMQINFKFWPKLVNSQANYNLFFST
jgi:hypothetical protein